MIPKVIHYCWFGKSPYPPLVKKCIESWKNLLPDYEIKQWNENNFDFFSCSFAHEAYYMKKWAFCADYARFKILYEYGGIYLDTDVEILKDITPLLNNIDGFLGMEAGGQYALGIIAVPPKSEWIKKMLDFYINNHFFTLKGIPDTEPVTSKLSRLYPNRTLPCKVYPEDYFYPMNWITGNTTITENTYANHHYTNTWKLNHKNRNVQRMINYFTYLKYFLFEKQK